MQYITSRHQLPDSPKEMAARPWFNMWKRRQWPYTEIVQGDLLYWYDSRRKEIVWLTRVTDVVSRMYKNKSEAVLTIRKKLGGIDRDDPYLKKRTPARGYYLAYKVSPIRKLGSPKPKTFRFPPLGWLRATEAIAKGWKLGPSIDKDVTLDDLAPKAALAERLRHLHSSMATTSPTRIQSIISQTIRRDTPIVRTLKQLCGYRCQFPNCQVRIPKRSGGFYIEVAHIQPVHKKGKSVLGNLLVLCPNHHKELDYGKLVIEEQTPDRVRGSLNGKEFDIRMPVRVQT